MNLSLTQYVASDHSIVYFQTYEVSETYCILSVNFVLNSIFVFVFVSFVYYRFRFLL